MLKNFLWILTTTIFVSHFFDKVIAYNLIETTQKFNNIKQYINDDTLMLISPPSANRFVTLLFPNGTNSVINIDVESQNGGNTLIDIYPLAKNYIWIMYARNVNEDSKDLNMFGMLMNWNQEVLAYDVNLNCPYDSSDHPTVATNINPDDGFIIITKNIDHQLTWNEFSYSFKGAQQPEHKSEQEHEPDEQVHEHDEHDEKEHLPEANPIKLISLGPIKYPEQTELIDYLAFGTLKGSYGVLILLKNLNVKNVDLINSYQAQPIYMAYLTFIHKNTPQNLQLPALVYETSEDTITSFEIQSCKVAFVDHANVCFLKSVVNRSDLFLSATVEISFLSTGSVININQLGLDNDNITPPEKPTLDTNNITDSVIPLENDGLLLIRHTGNSITGHIYDQNGNNLGREWDIPKILTENSKLLGFGMFKNNTAWIALDSLTDKIVSSDMPKFIQDSGYNNLLVVTTEPKINSILFAPYPETISVTYSIPITQSSGNITIYQIDEFGSNILRQTFPGLSEYCRIDENDKNTISCNVLNSTFNHLGTNYTVVVDNNFVKNSLLDEPLSGIQNGFWTFKTNASSTENAITEITEGLTVLLRLDYEGTRNFFADKDFLDHLHTELSQSIPIKHYRLVFNNRVQKDASTKDKRLLFEFKILEVGNVTEPNSQNVFHSLKTLIENKKITMLSTLSHARYLDETFDVHIVRDEFMARCEGNNSAIFKIPLVLFDLAFDILFVIYNGRKIPFIFIPSIIILAVSFAFNSFMSVTIITREISHNPDFQKWFDNHTKLATLFTVLAIADVEELYTLKSRIAGLESFSAPYSKVGLIWILYGSAINVLIVDFPQVIFQIIYLQTVLNYTLIPFFTLITSSLIFVIDLVSHVYDVMSKNCCKNSKVDYQPSRETHQDLNREPSRET
ncbi:17555_t:CDS:2 [Funneliformis geosporum]|uniref:17555_t:CDS:1 n=1 Tax=Funneliformis geosporum TaxID=1117311 RepID=A0A9W4WS52_9GLOM|nr:17555_t:CDS:2 [Funneliformis geosporum]